MKEKKLLQALGDVHEGYIEEICATVPQKRKPKLKVFWAVAAALCAIYYRHMANKQFGGVTGDLAGWFLQVTELVLTAVIVLGGKL